jgi:hypothetical protein
MAPGDFSGSYFLGARAAPDTGFWFRQVFSGFDLYRFIQDFSLFRDWFRQVYTGFWFIQGLV